MANGTEDQREPEVPHEVAPYERKVGNWLSAYLEYTKESESPDNYHIWAGLSIIASTIRRNVWLDQGLYVLFPNLYVAFVGPPARTAKSTAMWLGRQLLYDVPGIKIGPDSCSKEQLIRAMAESKFNNQCALTIHSSEFSSIIETSGIHMIQFLTDIFDGNYTPPGGWRYETKNAGKDTIVNPVLNLLVGTTPEYLADSMPDNIIGNGFTSRVILVCEDRERLINPRPSPSNQLLKRALSDDLRHISTIYGQFSWTEAGANAYDTFYRELYNNIPDDHRIQGYHWRKKIHVLKVAMLLALAEGDNLVLDERDIKAAAALLAAIEPKMPRAFSAVGKYEHASDLERIGSQIIDAGGLPFSAVFNRNYYSGSADDIRQIIEALITMGAVKMDRREDGPWLIPTGKNLPWR